MRALDEIVADLADFESAFVPQVIPAGTCNRKSLQRQAVAFAWANARLPENVKRRMALHKELASARRSEQARKRAIYREGLPVTHFRRWLFGWLRKLGFKREHVSGQSAYYRNGLHTVRISDHSVPWTDERACMDRTWSNSEWSYVYDAETPDYVEALRWLVTVRKLVRVS